MPALGITTSSPSSTPMPPSISNSASALIPPLTGKNIVVFCDGTGQDGLISSLSQEEKNDTQAQLEKIPKPKKKPLHAVTYPTNVLRLCLDVARCVKSLTNTIPQRLQIVFYQSGVGVGDDFQGNSDLGDDYEKARGTATASLDGIGSKIRDAYNFIAQNYTEGDKIFLFGFSRGAYTARKVAGLICKLGLLNTRQMGKFFHYWSALDRGDASVERSGRPASIDFLGVWDTVGSVYEDLVAPKVNALTLVDSELPEGVKVARHALSYHENRKEFLPTPFANYQSDRDVKQMWFPGVHSDVGGSYSEHLIADITLCWMTGEAIGAGLTIDEEFLLDCFTIPSEPAPELRLHFERHPNRALSILTVDRMATLVKTPESKEVLLTNIEPRFLYHQSLWAEIRESPKGSSYKAFPNKKNPSTDPLRASLSDFEKRYWDACKWNALLPLPVLPPSRGGRLPMARGSSPKLTPKSQSPSSLSISMTMAQRPVEFEMVGDYVEDMIESGTPIKYVN
ncbi:hypothetical protein RHS02_03246, partial [Rhizoctonia solani]